MDCTRREILGKLGIGFFGIGAMTLGLPVNKTEAEVITKTITKIQPSRLGVQRTRRATVIEKIEMSRESPAAGWNEFYQLEHEVDIVDDTFVPNFEPIVEKIEYS